MPSTYDRPATAAPRPGRDGPTENLGASRVTRRSFLRWGIGAAGAALLAQGAVGFWSFFKPRLQAGAFGSKVSAGRPAEFDPGTVTHVPHGRFYISRLADGSMLALWHRCTHLGCTIPWVEADDRFHCPCHSSIFDQKGEVQSGPAPRPLDIFPIEIVEGEVVVDTGSPIQRDRFDPSQTTVV